MVKLPSEDIAPLLKTVLTKRKWTKKHLAKHLGIQPNAISRWLAGRGIHKTHRDDLLRLSREDGELPAEPINFPAMIPFSVTIPRNSLVVSLDKNGDINVRGLLLATLIKEDK